MNRTPLRRRGRLLALLAASVTACLILVAGPAVVGQEAASPLALRRVDATNPKAVTVDLIWTGQRDALTDVTVRENGQARKLTASPEPLSALGVKRGLVVVVDTSRSMATNGGVLQTQETLRDMVAALEDDESMGLVSFGSQVQVHSKLTTDKEDLLEAVDELVAPAQASTAMWDGVRKGASLFLDKPEIQANLVLITDGFDDSSDTTLDQAASDVSRVGGAVFALAYDAQNQVDLDSLNTLVGKVGGSVTAAPEEPALANGLLEVQSSLTKQYRLTFESAGEQGATDLEVTVADAKVRTTFVSGADAAGQANLAPPVKSRSMVPSFLQGPIGLLLAVGFGGLAVALAVLAIASLASKDDGNLDRVLMQYTDGPGESEGDDGLVQTALVQRAVELTEEFATQKGVLVKVEAKLERADLPLRAAEALFFYVVAALVITVIGLILGGLFGFVAGAFLGFMVPMAILNFLGGRRSKQFNSQLPDMLQLLAGSLRAGYSLVQGVDAVSGEVDGPMGRELRRVMTEARLGRELEDALEASAERVDSKDFEWAVMAVRIQREVGGNLSELLMTVADTMVDRERLRRDVSTLTAEGKMSAIIIGFLPVALGLVMYVMNPEYMGVLFTNSLGKILLGAGITAALIGFAWMKKCITIEV